MDFKEEFKDYIEKGWHYADLKLFNAHLDYETNKAGGCDLPDYDQPVICFKPEDPAYFIGSFSDDGTTVFDNLTGRACGKASHVLWTYMPDFCYEE